MKATSVFFSESNFVGREVETIQELVKAMESGLDLADCNGIPFNGEVHDEDEEGHGTWRTPTKNEIFMRAKAALENEEDKVYLGMFLKSEDYSIHPAKETTLQSDFYIGQEVWTLMNDRLMKLKIVRLWLSKGGKKITNVEEVTKRIFYAVEDTIRKETITASYQNISAHDKKFLTEEIEMFMVRENDFAMVTDPNGHTYVINLDRLFPSVEDLANELIRG